MASDITVGNLILGIKTKLDEFKQGMQEAGNEFTGLGKTIEKHRGEIATVGLGFAAVGASITAALGFAASVSMKFNKEMANVSTMLGGSKDKTNDLKDALQDMSVEVGKSTSDLAAGAYQVVSAFGDTADTVEILDTSARAATAGVATTTDAINLLSGVSKGYGDTAPETLKKISDLAFKTVELGQTTFPELAASMGRVVPIANEMGIAQEELFAVMATGTGVTGTASEVSTQFRGVLQALMAPTEDMTKLIEKSGFASGKTMLKQLGLADTLALIIGETEKTGIPLQKYMGSIEGQTLALALAGAQSDTYAFKLEEMGKATGATDAAFKAQTKGVNSAGFAWDQLTFSVHGIWQEMGDALQPVIEVVADSIKTLTEKVRDFMKDHPKLTTGLTLAAGAIGLIVSAIGGLLLLSIPLAAFVVSLAAIGPIITAAGVLLTSLLAVSGPILLGIAALAAAVYLIYTNWNELTAALDAGYEMFVKPVLGGMKTLFESVWGAIKTLVLNGWTALSGFFISLGEVLSPFFDFFIGGWNWIHDTVKGIFGIPDGSAWKLVESALKGIYNSFRWLLDKLGIELPEIEDLFSGIKTTGSESADTVKGKWTEFKDKYKENMADVEKKHEESSRTIEKKAAETTDTIVKEDAIKYDSARATEEEKEEYAREFEREQLRKSVTDMLADEKEQKDAADEKKLDALIAQNEKETAEVKVAADEQTSYWDGKWLEVMVDVESEWDNTLLYLSDAIKGEAAYGGLIYEGFAGLRGAASNIFSDIASDFQIKVVDVVSSKVTTMFSGMGTAISGLAGSIAGLGVAAVAGEVVNKVVSAFTPDYEAQRKAREQKQAFTREYYTLSGIESELKGSEWAWSEEDWAKTYYQLEDLWTKKNRGEKLSTYRGISGRGQSEQDLFNKLTQDYWAMQQSVTAGLGYEELVRMKRDMEADLGPGVDIIKMLYGRAITFAELEQLGKTSMIYEGMPHFHAGGIVPGMAGQERLISALAGEEVLSRSDPRHASNNWGGINVTITGNQISSELDLTRIARIVGEEIMKSLKYQVQFAR